MIEIVKSELILFPYKIIAVDKPQERERTLTKIVRYCIDNKIKCIHNEYFNAIYFKTEIDLLAVYLAFK